MAYEDSLTIRVGEKRVIEGGITNSIGTFTASSATFSLYDAFGNVVAGFNNVTASLSPSNIGSTAYQTGSAYYDLDTTSLAPGVYYAYFGFSITGSDTIVRNIKPDVQIAIWPIVEFVASYDPGTWRGRVRQWLRDIAEIPTRVGTAMGIINPIWPDAEVDLFIAQADSTITPTDNGTLVPFDQRTILLAASIGWEQSAGDKARVATIEKIAIFSDDTVSSYKAMKDYAAYLRSKALLEVTPTSTDSDHFLPDYAGQVVPYNSSGRTSEKRPMNTW